MVSPAKTLSLGVGRLGFLMFLQDLGGSWVCKPLSVAVYLDDLEPQEHSVCCPCAAMASSSLAAGEQLGDALCQYHRGTSRDCLSLNEFVC